MHKSSNVLIITQSTWQKIRTLGLANCYQEDDEFRLFCGQLDVPALLPVHKVMDGMQHLKDTMPDDAEPLVEYFDPTYLSSQLRQQQLQQDDGIAAPIRIRNIPPMFKPEAWNMHQVTHNGEPHTHTHTHVRRLR